MEGMGDERGSRLHMRQGVFSDGEHLEDIAAECAFDVVQINFCQILAQHLLGRVVDEDIEAAKSTKYEISSEHF